MSKEYNKDRTKQKAKVITDDRKDKSYVREKCKEIKRGKLYR